MQLVVHHWNAGPGGLEAGRAALSLALKRRHWLVVLNAHVAPFQIRELLQALSTQNYLVRRVCPFAVSVLLWRPCSCSALVASVSRALFVRSYSSHTSIVIVTLITCRFGAAPPLPSVCFL